MTLTNSEAKIILEKLSSTGADYAELYFQNSISHSYQRRYRRVENISSSKVRGCGLRILKGEEEAYGYTSDITFESICSLAESLSSAFDGERVMEIPEITDQEIGNLNPIEIPHSAVSTDEKIAYLKKGEDAVFASDERISDFIGTIVEQDEHVDIYNSEGKHFADDRVRTRVIAMTIATDGTQFQNAFWGKGYSIGLELFDQVDYVKEALTTAEEAVAMLSAVDCPSGEMPVVLGNGFGGVLFHEACGHPLEGSSVAEKTSPFSFKYGQQIASPIVNAFDNGIIPNGWGTENIDDEGEQPTTNQLIKDGRLVSYMLDRKTSRKMGGDFKPTGSCRRQNYRYNPTTRMTNTYIDNGTSTKEEIIASVKNGLYCKTFTGGQVNTTTDQFNFTSSIAYLIKDGKIDRMVKPVSLIGYGYEILPKITMIANDLARSEGQCGAASGTCYVEVGQPTLLVSSMLVGGTGGDDNED